MISVKLQVSIFLACRPYNLYCVGGDVKPCSINQSCLLVLMVSDMLCSSIVITDNVE